MNAPREEVPNKVGRYQIVESIGFGAMGAVYKAFDPLIKRTIAIKTIRLDIPPQSPHYRTFIERFYHEARISGTLSHPNIVTLFDIGETDDKVPFLAMEYIEGETIADVLNQGRHFRPEQVIGLVSQMAAAIDYAHAKGVIHRDIKPSNIIVHDGEKVKVTDFGIAKLVDSDITHSGSLLGTPSYMSPEQAMGESLDGRSDIFSLGVVAFEMLSGQQPFPGNNVTSILYKLVHADPVRPPNLEVLGLLPDKWHQVFSKVLSKNPPDRYGTGADFVSELELCLGSWFGSLEGETVYMNAPDKIASSRAPVSSPPGPEKTAPPANLMGADEGDESDDEEVVFDGAAETVKDNPAFWGSPETNVVDEASAQTAHTRVANPFLAVQILEGPYMHPLLRRHIRQVVARLLATRPERSHGANRLPGLKDWSKTWPPESPDRSATRAPLLWPPFTNCGSSGEGSSQPLQVPWLLWLSAWLR